jgi:translation initiation factor 5A
MGVFLALKLNVILSTYKNHSYNMENSHLCPPVSAGEIKKGDIIILKSRPCKIVEIHRSKTGKHGHAKCRFIGTCILSGRKYEDSVPAHTTLNRAEISKKKYQVLGTSDDNIDCLNENNVIVHVPANDDEKLINLINTGHIDEIDVLYAPIMENNHITEEIRITGWSDNSSSQ